MCRFCASTRQEMPNILFLNYYYYFFKDFIYSFDRGREITSRQNGKQREEWKQVPCGAESLRRGLIPGSWDPDLS